MENEKILETVEILFNRVQKAGLLEIQESVVAFQTLEALKEKLKDKKEVIIKEKTK